MTRQPIPLGYLVALDGLLCLRVGLVGVVQSNLQLVDLSLQLLLHSEHQENLTDLCESVSRILEYI